MPKLDGILETAIYTEDMVVSVLDEGVLGLEPIYSDDRLSAYAVAGHDVLLVFRKGPRARPSPCPAGPFPVMAAMARCMWRSPSARTTRSLGDASRFARGCHRRAERLVSRRPQHIFPRPRRAPFGTRNAGIVVGVLGATNYFPCLTLGRVLASIHRLISVPR